MHHMQHITVLKEETILSVIPSKEDIDLLHKEKMDELIFCDATLGGAGHALRLIEEFNQNPLLKSFNLTLIGFDRDEHVLEKSRNLLESAKREGKKFNFFLFHTTFSSLKEILSQYFDGKKLYGFYADFGVSSFQLDDAERGFSFSKHGPVDMRMDRSTGLTAKDILLNYSQKDLERLFFDYGEEPKARKLAKCIVMDREKDAIPLDTTYSLAEYFRRILAYPSKSKTHPATRAFQALRIEVNGELTEIKQLLVDLPSLMHSFSNTAFISFHSLEDRLVKRAMRNWQKGKNADEEEPAFDHYTNDGFLFGFKEKSAGWGLEAPRGGIVPSSNECSQNFRARSARLRCFKFKRQAEKNSLP